MGIDLGLFLAYLVLALSLKLLVAVVVGYIVLKGLVYGFKKVRKALPSRVPVLDPA